MSKAAPRTTKVSAGLLLYRERRPALIEVLLGHPGGPFWAKKDLGAWSIPKGEVERGEGLLAAAKRETFEETGLAPDGPFIALGSVTQKSGKVVHCWAARHDEDVSGARSNLVEIEWPAGSGRSITFPELDQAVYFAVLVARTKLNPAQVAFVDRLALLLERPA